MCKLLSRTLLTLTLLFSTACAEPTRAYFGTGRGGEGIYTATFDTATGTLSPITLAAAIEFPGFLAIHPNQQFLYSTNAEFDKPNTGGVAAFRIHHDGSLSLLNQQPTIGTGACHLSIDATGQSVIAVNYASGTLAAFKINKDDSLTPATSTHQHTGSGEHPKRQDGPHPHSAFIHPNNQYVYVPDLGTDKVMIYSLDSEQGTLTPAGHADVPGGSQGPRHMKFSKDGKHAYVLNELSLTLATYSVNPGNGQLDHTETISVFTEGNAQELDTMSCAEIRIHPNGKWIYASTRDLEGQGRDTLSTFQRTQDGTLQLIANTPASVHFPRNFNIDPTGQWLIAAGQRSSTLAIFSIDPTTGALALKRTNIPFVGQPTCVEFLSAK
jgi:6-phosphogluconolactonase